MELFCDLHTHSYYSDGTDSPKKIIDLAVEKGLKAVALCDHNTIGGLDEFTSYASNKNVIAVPGCEISTDYGDVELHILALFIKKENYGKITEFVKPMLDEKLESNRVLIEKLNKNGYNISFEKLVSENPEGHFNRANIASELFKLGYVNTVKEAFKTVLSKTEGFYISPKRKDCFETIRFIKSIGAIPVLAHPFFDLNEQQLREFLKLALPCGLMGMETMYSSYTSEQFVIANQIAKEFNLYESGGSDYHGENKPHIVLGEGKGNLKIPYEFYLTLNGLLNK